MADRVERMKADANDLAAKIYEQFSETVRALQLEESSLRFEIKIEGNWREVSICFNDDYPDSTVIWGLENVNPGRMTAEDAFMVVARKCKLLSDGRLKLPEMVFSYPEDDDDRSTVPKRTRCTSPEKAAGGQEQSDTDNDDETDEEMEAWPECTVELNQIMKNDLEECRGTLGNEACVFVHRSSSLETCEIMLNIPFEGVEETLAQAWGMNPQQPVRILLMDVSVAYYRSTHHKPEVKVYQASMTDKPGVCLRQLQRIIQKYVDEFWICKEDPKDCILLNISIYARERLPALCDHCVICDTKHELTAMFMPSVCSRDLCIFAYETLGVMADFDVRFNSQMEVMDLLLKMLTAAASSPRRDLILDPYPSIPDPDKKGEMAITESKKDYDLVSSVTKRIPCIRTLREISEQENSSCADQLRKRHPLLFPLIRWTFTSNRAYLMKLSESDQLPFFNTRHQYLMMLDSPAKEAAFRDAKAKHGESVFAFHGSPFENWHSILRRGLINASGTHLQMVGAAHGNGIYLSPHLNFSITYALRRSAITGETTACFQAGGHDCTEDGRFLSSRGVFACIALCEVVPTAELRKATSQIWVLSNPDLVCTRFFLVFDKGYVAQDGGTGIDCTQPETLTKIRDAVQKFRTLTTG